MSGILPVYEVYSNNASLFLYTFRMPYSIIPGVAKKKQTVDYGRVFVTARSVVLTGFSFTKRAVRKIPTLVWGTFAVIGILMFGFIGGFSAGTNPSYTPTPLEAERVKNAHYRNLIRGYEDLSELYRLQGQNVGVIMNTELLLTNPEEVRDAFNSISQHREMINVQIGRIMELRRAAGYSDSRELLRIH